MLTRSERRCIACSRRQTGRPTLSVASVAVSRAGAGLTAVVASGRASRGRARDPGPARGRPSWHGGRQTGAIRSGDLARCVTEVKIGQPVEIEISEDLP